MKKICVVIGSRANYASSKSLLRAIDQHNGLTLQLVVGASAVLDRYGSVVNLIENDGFSIDATIHMLVEGESPVTMAKSTGLGLIELPSVFSRLQPDIVVTIGDRFETMATAIAASYMNIPLAHTMGGEVSGTIDESIRHAVTKLAHLHFAASQSAAERIIKMGENPDHVFNVGCPRIDLIKETITNDKSIDLMHIFGSGVGDILDVKKPFLLLLQHPVTTEYADAEAQISETLKAVQSTGLPTITMWPNADAGSDGVSRGIRKFREDHPDYNMHFFKNLQVEDYIWLMHSAVCLLGNSSSGIRDAAYIGTPVVNIGTRQDGRDRGQNVVDAKYSSSDILDKLNHQLRHGRYPSDAIYGDGNSGGRIADLLHDREVSVQKSISY